MLAITVSQGQPSTPARARIAEVFPLPGGPHSRTGALAAMATPSASTVACWVRGILISVDPPQRSGRTTFGSGVRERWPALDAERRLVEVAPPTVLTGLVALDERMGGR